MARVQVRKTLMGRDADVVAAGDAAARINRVLGVGIDDGDITIAAGGEVRMPVDVFVRIGDKAWARMPENLR